jgi:tetratricopeptide (TPR) repeat protein
MRKHLSAMLGVTLLTVAPMGFGYASGGGPSSNGDGPAGAVSSDLQNAVRAAKSAFYQGLSAVHKGQMYDAEAAKTSTPEKYSIAHNKAQRAYGESLSAFIDAVAIQPTLYQAWNYLGFANLHLGNYEDAASAYTKALDLNPNNPEAIAHRGEAFLGLNQIEDAKAAYMALIRDSPSLADELMTAMRRWTDAHRQNAQELSAAEIELLAKWIDERAAIAAQTVRR